MHLSFTSYELPCSPSRHGAFDQEALFVQAAIRAYEKGQWVADVDMLTVCKMLFSGQHVAQLLDCGYSLEDWDNYIHLNVTSVDSWLEFLIRRKMVSLFGHGETGCLDLLSSPWWPAWAGRLSLLKTGYVGHAFMKLLKI